MRKSARLRRSEAQAPGLSSALEEIVANRNDSPLSNLANQATSRFCVDDSKDSLSLAPAYSRGDLPTGTIHMIESGGDLEADGDNEVDPKPARRTRSRTQK